MERIRTAMKAPRSGGHEQGMSLPFRPAQFLKYSVSEWILIVWIARRAYPWPSGFAPRLTPKSGTRRVGTPRFAIATLGAAWTAAAVAKTERMIVENFMMTNCVSSNRWARFENGTGVVKESEGVCCENWILANTHGVERSRSSSCRGNRKCWTEGFYTHLL